MAQTSSKRGVKTKSNEKKRKREKEKQKLGKSGKREKDILRKKEKY